MMTFAVPVVLCGREMRAAAKRDPASKHWTLADMVAVGSRVKLAPADDGLELAMLLDERLVIGDGAGQLVEVFAVMCCDELRVVVIPRFGDQRHCVLVEAVGALGHTWLRGCAFSGEAVPLEPHASALEEM